MKTHFPISRTAMLLASVLALSPVANSASAKFHTPAPGSRERRAILDSLRRPVSRGERKPVIFTGVDLKVGGGWAYVEAQTVDARGNRIGPEFTNMVSALLRGSGNKWRVVEWAYAGDVISIEWEKKHRAVPRKLWPHRR